MMGPIELESEPVSTLDASASSAAFVEAVELVTGGEGGAGGGQGASCLVPAATYPGHPYLHPGGEHDTPLYEYEVEYLHPKL